MTKVNIDLKSMTPDELKQLIVDVNTEIISRNAVPTEEEKLLMQKHYSNRDAFPHVPMEVIRNIRQRLEIGFVAAKELFDTWTAAKLFEV